MQGGTIVQRNKSSNHASLNVENPSFPARTSLDWLKQHGLKGGVIVWGGVLHFLNYQIHTLSDTDVVFRISGLKFLNILFSSPNEVFTSFSLNSIEVT